MKTFIKTVILMMVMFSLVFSQKFALNVREIQPVAEKAVETYAKLVTEKNFQTMGLKSLDEKDKVVPGKPLKVFMIRLDQLQEYKAGTEPASLLIGGDVVIYPLLIGEEIRAAIDLQKVKEKWEVTGIGSANLAKILFPARRRAAELSRSDISSFAAVRIPALNLIFLGYYVEKQLMLIPVFDDPANQLKAGEAMPAAKVFELILPAAKKHQDLPG